MCFLSSSPIYRVCVHLLEPGGDWLQGTSLRYAVRAALADWTSRATMHSRKPIGDGLRKYVYTERGRKTLRKIHTKEEGVPLGNPLEKGTWIIPCMSRFKTSSVEVRDILVWELGQTCEAARNGTRIMFWKEVILSKNHLETALKLLTCQRKPQAFKMKKPKSPSQQGLTACKIARLAQNIQKGKLI